MKKLSKKEAELKEKKRIKTLRRKSGNLSISEGIFWSVRNSFGDYYLTPFAIAINSGNSLVAMMTAISGLVGPVSQIFSSKRMEKTPRKKLVTKAVLLESFIWIFFIAAGILFYKNIILSVVPAIFISLFAIYTIITNFSVAPWFSWMGDLIDDKNRGKWLSKRNLLIGFSTAILVIGSSFFLEYMKEKNLAIIGFGILFLLAFFARLKSWRTLKKEYEPKIQLKKIKEEKPFTFINFIKRAPKTNFGKFAIFRLMFSLGVVVYSSLLTVYLLRELNLSYIYYMIIITSSTVFSLVFVEIWGKISDRYGNYKILAITTMLIPVVPIIWILSDSAIYLIFVPGIIRGIAWSGFDIASNNFIYDNVRPEKRGRAVSFYNMMVGIGTFAGGVISAILIKIIKDSAIHPIKIIFIISSLMTMLIVYLWVSKITEAKVKPKKRQDLKKYFLRNLRPTISEEAHQIVHLKKYLIVK